MFLWATAAGLLAGCNSAQTVPVVVPDQLTLYSIDGRDRFPPEQPPNPGQLDELTTSA